MQPHYTAQLLSAIGKANHAVLSNLQLSQKHSLPIPVQENISLARFCELGARDPDIAWPFYQALWKELQSPGRPPIVFTLDAINHVIRDARFEPVELDNDVTGQTFTGYAWANPDVSDQSFFITNTMEPYSSPSRSRRACSMHSS